MMHISLKIFHIIYTTIQTDNLSKRNRRKVLFLNLKSDELNSSLIEHQLRKKVKINALKQKQISRKITNDFKESLFSLFLS
jgi:hypothetical protein